MTGNPLTFLSFYAKLRLTFVSFIVMSQKYIYLTHIHIPCTYIPCTTEMHFNNLLFASPQL